MDRILVWNFHMSWAATVVKYVLCACVWVCVCKNGSACVILVSTVQPAKTTSCLSASVVHVRATSTVDSVKKV